MSPRRRTEPRRQPKQHRSQSTVDVVLEATARVLVREGYERATTNRIAEVAGVSVGSLYQFFPSKHALFTALRRRHYEQLIELFSKFDGLRSLPLRAATRAAVDLIIRVHAADPELHKALEEEVPARDVESNREIERGSREIALAYLREHRAEVGVEDLELAAFVAVHMVEALTHAAVVHCPERLREDRFAEEITDLVVRYLQG